ncbi:MAG: LamG-like jellyroll fold domain-containing protein [Bacteroidota bacterium]|jgi:hypothetical protein
MLKNISKILRQTTDHIYIAESTDGNEPSWSINDEIGYTDEASIQIKSKKIVVTEGGGADIQTARQYELSLNALQIISFVTLLAFTNKNVWILVKPTGIVGDENCELLIKNFLINTEETLDTKAGGKSFVSISGKKNGNPDELIYEFRSVATTIDSTGSTFLTRFPAVRFTPNNYLFSATAPFNNIGHPKFITIGAINYVYYTKFETTSNGTICRRAISGDITVPGSYGAEEIMLAPPGGTNWDGDFVRLGSIVLSGGTYYMFYGGYLGTNGPAIGLATSPDGATWTRTGSPILSPDATYISVEDPDVILDSDGTWVMYYSYRTSGAVLPGVLAATSLNGITWTKIGEVLHIGSTYDSVYIEGHEIYKESSVYYLIYDCYDGTSWSIAIASSTNRIGTFSRYASNPVFEKSGVVSSFDQYHVATQDVFEFGGYWYMYFQGGDNAAYISSNWKLGISYLGAAPPAPTTYSTVLLLHTNGADGGTVFTDEAGKTVTPTGATTTTTAPKFGTACGNFSVSGTDYLSVPDSVDFDFGSGSFTIDFWVKSSLGNDGGIISKRENVGSLGWAVEIRATGAVWLRAKVNGVWNDTFLITAAGAVTANTWTHIAIVRNGSAWTIFVNGTSAGTATNAGVLDNQSSVVIIGSSRVAGGIEDNFPGYIDELRVSKGIARWTANFTPPASEYTLD